MSETAPSLAEGSENNWPGLEPAQAFVLPSYQWMLARVEAADSRIQNIVNFAATVTLAVPTAAKNYAAAISFRSPFLIAAVVLALVVIADGMFARTRGALALVDPMVLYNKSVWRPKWEFHRNALYFAGKHMESNAALVNAKARVVLRMTCLFVIEMALLFAWVATA